MKNHRLKAVGIGIFLIVLWQIAYAIGLLAQDSFPSPIGILSALWVDSSDIIDGSLTTGLVALKGFLIGNSSAIVLALLFFYVPRLRVLFHSFFLSIFSVPLVVFVPLLATLYGGSAGVVLVSISVLYPTLVATYLGLERPDTKLLCVTQSAGATKLQEFLKVRVPTTMPTILAGLRMACPVAILGAILIEFALGKSGQGESGLGRYLLGSMTNADIDKIWAIAFAATLLALLPYLLFSVVGSHLTRRTRSDRPAQPYIEKHDRTHLYRTITGVIVALALWQIFIYMSGKSMIIAKGPIEIVQIISSARFPEIMSQIIHSGLETLPLLIIGILTSLAISFSLALLNLMFPSTRSFWMFSLIVQAVPLVVFVPLVVTIFGRGQFALVTIVVSATILPSYETMYQGLSAIPKHYFDVAMAHGSTRLSIVKKVCIPSTVPFFFEALRLIAPRALLGALLGEYILTYSGLGGLLAQARGASDYQMLWFLACVTTALSVMVHLLLTIAVSRASKSRQIEDRIW